MRRRRQAWLLIVGVLVGLGLFMVGVVGLIAGIAEQHAADNTFKTRFAHPGDDCGSSDQDFDVTNGDPLTCGPPGISPLSGTISFPGFTRSQNTQVQQLAKTLGAGGLTDTEQQQVQYAVDRFAKGVADSRRPHYDEGVSLGRWMWGTRLAIAGGIALAGSVGIMMLLYRS